MQIGAGQQSVVVEHLLEVGDQPVGVDRVAGEPAAQVVVHAAGSHGIQSGGEDPDRLGFRGPGHVPEEGLEAHGLGELRGPAKSTPLVIVLGDQVGDRRGQGVGGWGVLGRTEVTMPCHVGRQAVS